jgi:hypothetical protein
VFLRSSDVKGNFVLGYFLWEGEEIKEKAVVLRELQQAIIYNKRAE